MLSPTMPFIGLVPLLSAWMGAAFGAAAEPQAAVTRMVVRDEVVIHVPIGQRPRLEWVERKGPKCLPASTIAGAAISGPSSVDFLLRDRRRVRAELDHDCVGLDFYGGFYVEPEAGAVCARREAIRSQAGSTCRIERFRRLVPRVKR